MNKLSAAGMAVLIALAYGAHVFSEKTERLAKAVARVAVAEVKINGVHTQVLEAESSQRGYLLVNDPGYLDPFHAARTRGEVDLATTARTLDELNVDARGLDEISEIVAQKYHEMDKTVALAQAGQRDAAIDIVRAKSQVLANLLDDAAKYLSDARVGRIVLRGGRTAT